MPQRLRSRSRAGPAADVARRRRRGDARLPSRRRSSSRGSRLPRSSCSRSSGTPSRPSMIESLSPLAAFRRSLEVARADLVHALGGLATLVLMFGLARLAMGFLLRQQADNTLRVAIFLADTVLGPILFLGARSSSSISRPRRDDPRRAASPHVSPSTTRRSRLSTRTDPEEETDGAVPDAHDPDREGRADAELESRAPARGQSRRRGARRHDPAPMGVASVPTTSSTSSRRPTTSRSPRSRSRSAPGAARRSSRCRSSPVDDLLASLEPVAGSRCSRTTLARRTWHSGRSVRQDLYESRARRSRPQQLPLMQVVDERRPARPRSLGHAPRAFFVAYPPSRSSPMTRSNAATVLTVDDDPIVRADLRLVLEDAGFDVLDDARDGVEAVELAQDAPPRRDRARPRPSAPRRGRGDTPDSRRARGADRGPDGIQHGAPAGSPSARSTRARRPWCRSRSPIMRSSLP